MFRKKNCQKCRKKISEDYEFCPYCGSKSADCSQEDMGMLGKNDFFDMANLQLPAGFSAVFNALVKNLSRQFTNLDKETQKSALPKNSISISISAFGNNPPKVRINSADRTKPEKLRVSKAFPLEKQKKFSSLKRQEPQTNVRRLANRVVYELDLPGVKSTEDIALTKLENSIEIRAIASDKSYFKLIPINLPLSNLNLEQGRLILEFADKD